MSYQERHNKIAKRFSKLNTTLEEKRNNYLEKISNIINKAVKQYKDKNLWKESYNDIVDYIYAALTDTYLETTIALREIYSQILDQVVDIEDFVYKEDKITLPKRIKNYWDEAAILLKKPKVNTQEIALALLTAYDKILNNEMINVKQGVKKVKKPIDNDGIEIVYITDGECCTHGGIYLADELSSSDFPPYHINCQCDCWYEIYYPTDEADLEELQELGWEEEDG